MDRRKEEIRSVAELRRASDRNRNAFDVECRNLQYSLKIARQQIQDLDALHRRVEQQQSSLAQRGIADSLASLASVSALTSATLIVEDRPER